MRNIVEMDTAIRGSAPCRTRYGMTLYHRANPGISPAPRLELDNGHEGLGGRRAGSKGCRLSEELRFGGPRPSALSLPALTNDSQATTEIEFLVGQAQRLPL